MKRISLLLLTAFLGFSSAAYAETKVEEARGRFQRGVELYKEGSFDAALAEFNKAYELAPNYRVLYNMAQVQSERHDYVAALKLLEKYLDEGGNDIAAERREQVTKEIGTLKGRVAPLNVSTELEGAELLVDGVVVGTTPLKEEVLVSAGVRQIQLKKEGYETGSQTLTVAGGEEVKVEFNLKEQPKASATPSVTYVQGPASATGDRSSKPEGPPSKAPMWITLVTTGLFTGGAVTFAVLTKKSDKDLDKELDTFPTDPARVNKARDEVKRNALITDGLTAAAVVSGGLFVYFAIATSGGSAKTDTKTAHVRIVPAPTSLHVVGNF